MYHFLKNIVKYQVQKIFCRAFEYTTLYWYSLLCIQQKLGHRILWQQVIFIEYTTNTSQFTYYITHIHIYHIKQAHLTDIFDCPAVTTQQGCNRATEENPHLGYFRAMTHHLLLPVLIPMNQASQINLEQCKF